MEKQTILATDEAQVKFDELLKNGTFNNLTQGFVQILDHVHEFHQELMYRPITMLGLDSQKLVLSFGPSFGSKQEYGMIAGTYTIMLRTVYTRQMVAGVEITTTFISPLLNTSQNVSVFNDGDIALIDLINIELYRQLNRIGEERHYAG